MNTVVIIPAYNEEASIKKVIEAIEKKYVSRIIVVDNASTDGTAECARQAGAEVFYEPKRGYGQACLRGIQESGNAEILVFLDADFSDDPRLLVYLLEPIIKDDIDLVIGSRVLGKREPGALPPHALFGNHLACFLIRLLYGYRFTDLGPFRAVKKSALDYLGMRDTNYGWTVEMQVKAAKCGLRCTELAVPYRKRIGRSKISGTLLGSAKAGYKILWTIFRVWLEK